MNTTAIICEYNPFHNGHALHLRAAREETGARYLLCAMSGSWVQRGEMAIVDKWTRARMALEGGADLVLELPAAWAVRAAPDFALGAVALLDSLGVCSKLCFGSEVPLGDLRREAERREDKQALRERLDAGQSYPRALGSGLAAALPNATLGLEYLRAIQAVRSAMEPVAIPREAPHDAPGIQALASASAIRAATRANLPYEKAMPQGAVNLYKRALALQGGEAGWERLAPLLLYKLRMAGQGRYADGYGLSEGLDNRLTRAARGARTIEELLALAKTKRYTHARLRRAIAHILMDTTPELLEQKPGYARILGFRREAQPLLRAIDRQCSTALITKLPREIADEQLALDLRAQELWALSCPQPRRAGMDYTQSLVIV